MKPHCITAALLAVCLCACSGFLDLEQPTVAETYPATSGQIIKIDDALRVRFSHSMNQGSAAAVVEVADTDNSFRYEWQDERTLLLRPRRLPLRGERAELIVEGSALTADGRILSAHRRVAFFWEEADMPALDVENCSPASASALTARQSITLAFNRLPGEAAFRSAATLSPDCAYLFSTQNGIVTLQPLETWPLRQTLRLHLDPGLRSAEGPAMGHTWEGVWQVQAGSAPAIAEYGTCRNSAASSFSPLGTDWVQIDPDCALYLVFSADMDQASVLRNLGDDAPSALEAVWMDKRRLILQPAQQLEGGTSFRVYLDAGACDLEGNSMDAWQAEVSVKPGWLLAELDVVSSEPVPTLYATGTTGLWQLSTVLRFSGPIDSAQVRNAVEGSLRLQAFFPPFMASPVQVGRRWNAGMGELVVDWRGIEPGSPERESFYELSIPAGSTVTADCPGLEKDFSVVFKVVLP